MFNNIFIHSLCLYAVYVYILGGPLCFSVNPCIANPKKHGGSLLYSVVYYLLIYHIHYSIMPILFLRLAVECFE